MMEHFSRFVGPVIDKVLGLRCTSFCAYKLGVYGGDAGMVLQRKERKNINHTKTLSDISIADHKLI